MYRIEQHAKEGVIFYTIDEVDSIKIVDLYKMDDEVAIRLDELVKSTENIILNIKNPILFDFAEGSDLGNILKAMSKNDFDTYVKGKIPEVSVLRENDLSLKFDLLNTERNPSLQKYKLRKTIAEYSKGKRVLNLFPGVSDLTVASFLGGAKDVTEGKDFTLEPESDFNKKLNDIDTSIVAEVKGDFQEAIKNMQAPFQRFDLIVLDLSVLEKYFPEEAKKFKELHKDTIRDLQHMLLEQGGILILISDDLDFHLDNYIRPGADRLTKYLTAEEYSDQKHFHAYAFYK